MNNSSIPNNTWTRKFSSTDPSKSIHSFSRPPILEALNLLPVAFRVGSYINTERSNGREPIFDLNGIGLEPPNPGPHSGCPCGGLGGGAIGRGFRGDFRRWSLFPGRYIHRQVEADQFSLRIKRTYPNGEVNIDAIVLSLPPNDHNSSSLLSNWNWTMKPDCATYHAIYPRSWTVYKNPLPDVTVIIRQVSPFLPHNYSDSSLPVCLFHVDIENTGEDDMDVSIMFSFQNGDGGDEDAVGDFIHYPYNIDVNNNDIDNSNSNNGDEIHSNIIEGSKVIHGISMSHHRFYSDAINSPGSGNNNENERNSKNINISNTKTTQRQGSFSIATLTNNTNDVDDDNENNIENNTNKKVSYCNQFITHQKLNRCNPLKSFMGCDSSGGNELEVIDTSAELLWSHFLETGDAIMMTSAASKIATHDHIETSSSGSKVASAICVRQMVGSKTTATISFSLAWDHPVVKFGSGTNLPRYYTKFFGKSGLSAANIASYALLNSHIWEDEIIKWQNETIKTSENNDIPDYYRYHLFNELYYLVDGGTVWTDSYNGIIQYYFFNKQFIIP
jgi:non-lysosomal glucosylceramidase